MNTAVPRIGVYKHFKKGDYYFLKNISKDCSRDKYVCHYFSLFAPETGIFTRDLSEWFTDVTNHLENTTGQTFRFERVVNPNFELNNVPTGALIEELSYREDSPLHGVDFIEELSKGIVSKDYVIGQYYEETKEFPSGVSTDVVLDDLETARNFYDTHQHTSNTKIFKRTFIEVK